MNKFIREVFIIVISLGILLLIMLGVAWHIRVANRMNFLQWQIDFYQEKQDCIEPLCYEIEFEGPEIREI